MTTYVLLIPYYSVRTLLLNLPIEYARLVFLGILCALIIVAHKENVQRLLHHTEPKFSFSADKEHV